MPMFNLIEYRDIYSKTSGRLWQYCKDIPARLLNLMRVMLQINLILKQN